MDMTIFDYNKDLKVCDTKKQDIIEMIQMLDILEKYITESRCGKKDMMLNLVDEIRCRIPNRSLFPE